MEKALFQTVEIIHQILFMFVVIAIAYDVLTLSFNYKPYIYIKFFILIVQLYDLVKLKIRDFRKPR